MKKSLKSIGILLMAGITYAACSGDDALTELSAIRQDNTWKATAVLTKVTADATTRSLTLNGNTLNAGWKTTDKVYVLENNVKVGYLSPTENTDNTTATVTGTLENALAADQSVTLRFPRVVVDYTGQDGKLETIAEKYDYAEATTTVGSVSGNEVVFNSAMLQNKQAIAKFTFSEPVTSVTITASMIQNTLPNGLTITSTTPTKEMYAALPLSYNIPDTYLFKASNGSKEYWAIRNNIYMENGKYYMAKIELEEYDKMATPLTFENATGSYSNVSLWNHMGLTIKYSVDGGSMVSSCDNILVTLQPNSKVQFYGDNTTYYTSFEKYTKFEVSGGDCYIYGNLMSLINSTSFSTLKKLTADNAFSCLFNTSGNIINHPFKDIVLPATTLTKYCYSQMFTSCKKLTRAPELPATVVPEGAYYAMFSRCSELRYVKCLATTLGEYSTSGWLNNVYSYGTFVKASSMTGWESGVDGIPSSWAVFRE